MFNLIESVQHIDYVMTAEIPSYLFHIILAYFKMSDNPAHVSSVSTIMQSRLLIQMKEITGIIQNIYNWQCSTLTL